jgi:hypothetical protein
VRGVQKGSSKHHPALTSEAVRFSEIDGLLQGACGYSGRRGGSIIQLLLFFSSLFFFELIEQKTSSGKKTSSGTSPYQAQDLIRQKALSGKRP